MHGNGTILQNQTNDLEPKFRINRNSAADSKTIVYLSIRHRHEDFIFTEYDSLCLHDCKCIHFVPFVIWKIKHHYDSFIWLIIQIWHLISSQLSEMKNKKYIFIIDLRLIQLLLIDLSKLEFFMKISGQNKFDYFL